MNGNSTTIERESKEVRPFYVRSVDLDEALVDVTSFDVDVAFARMNARPSTWHPAEWVAGGPFDSAIGRAWAAEAEVGGVGTGADVELAAGEWRVFVRVTTSSEAPVLDAGILIVD